MAITKKLNKNYLFVLIPSIIAVTNICPGIVHTSNSLTYLDSDKIVV